MSARFAYLPVSQYLLQEAALKYYCLTATGIDPFATAHNIECKSDLSFTDSTFVYAKNENGYINCQKGKTKYLVTGLTTGLTTQCVTANLANTALYLEYNEYHFIRSIWYKLYCCPVMTINHKISAQVAAGSLSIGTEYTIYSSGTTNWTAIGAASNLTGVTFIATGAGSGTGTVILANANPYVIATFNTAYAANTYRD